MSPRIALAPALYSLLALLFLSLTPIRVRAETIVTVVDYQFVPRDVVITLGETVTWTWGDGFHTTTNGAGPDDLTAGLLWDAFVFQGQKTLSFTFTSLGDYPYFCRFHEALNMKGSVKVLRYKILRHNDKSPGDATWGEIKSLYR